MRSRNERILIGPDWLAKLGVIPGDSAFAFEAMIQNAVEPHDGTGANSWDRYSSFSYGTVYFRTATLMRDMEEASRA